MPKSSINKVGVILYHGVSLFFISSYFRTLWVTFQAKNSVRSTPAMMHLPQISAYACEVVEKGKENKGKSNDVSDGTDVLGDKACLGG